MARVPMITRTIQTTRATILCLNVVEGEPCNMEVVLPRTFKDDKAILKAAEKVINNDELKAVHVADVVVEETRYCMSEQLFIANAEILHPLAKGEAEQG